MGIPSVDPGFSHNPHLSPLVFSHPTPTPTPYSTILLSFNPIPEYFILLRILVSTLFIQLLLQVQQLYSIIYSSFMPYSSFLLQHLTSSPYSTHHSSLVFFFVPTSTWGIQWRAIGQEYLVLLPYLFIWT